MAIGKISSGRSALEGDPIAPGNETTLNSLRDESRRPRALREPFPDHVTNQRPAKEFELDRDRFLKNLRCAKRGAAAGPSGMTSEHLRPLLDSVRDSELLWDLGRSFTRGQVPADTLPLIRFSRITALRKPSGGIRGIVVGCAHIQTLRGPGIHLEGAAGARQVLVDAGFDAPGWDDLAGGRPPPSFGDDPSTPKHGWQYLATQPVNHRFITKITRQFPGHVALPERTTRHCPFHVLPTREAYYV